MSSPASLSQYKIFHPSVIDHHCLVLWLPSTCWRRHAPVLDVNFQRLLNPHLFRSSMLLSSRAWKAMRLSLGLLWPHCFLLEYETVCGHVTAAPKTLYKRTSGLDQGTVQDPADAEACANQCDLEGISIDIYYWPEAQADTSCLSIIGNSTNPSMQGATTSDGIIYWGCTVQTPTSGQTYVTTATLTTLGSVSIKVPRINPWSSQPCRLQPLKLGNNMRQFTHALTPYLFNQRMNGTTACQ